MKNKLNINKMEKEVRKFKVEYSLDWTYGVEIKKLRATHVEIEHGISYDSSAKETTESLTKWLLEHRQSQAKIIDDQNDVIKSLPIDFVKWYSGMKEDNILRAYKRWIKEIGNVL